MQAPAQLWRKEVVSQPEAHINAGSRSPAVGFRYGTKGGKSTDKDRGRKMLQEQRWNRVSHREGGVADMFIEIAKCRSRNAERLVPDVHIPVKTLAERTT